MADFKFNCPTCKEALEVSEDMRGHLFLCMACGNQVRVPERSVVPPPLPPANIPQVPISPEAGSATIFCAQCGQKNDQNNFKCVRCGELLHGRPAAYVMVDDSTMGGLIPYKNAQALWAYYLGIFALIPCLGFPLAVAALVLGLRGLKFAALHPEAKGKAHCWVGIVLGSLVALASLIGILIVVANRSQR